MGGSILEIFLLDVEHFRERHFARPLGWIFGVIDRLHLLNQPIGIIIDDQLERALHRQTAGCVQVQVLADAVLQQGDIDDLIVLGDADALGKITDGGGRVAAAAHGRIRWACAGRPSRVRNLPAQLEQLALAHHSVVELQAGKLDLPRVVDLQLVEQPVVERAVVLELQGADRVGDAFDRIGLPVGEIVHGVDAPLIAGAVVAFVQDAVHDRVAQVEVAGGHIDLGPQDARPVGELALAHALEQVQVLVYRAVAIGAFVPRLGERAAVLADLFGAEVVDVRFALLDQADGPGVELVEVIRSEEQAVFPIEAQPADVADDRIRRTRPLLW